MAIILNEQTFVANTEFQFEERLNSPLARFLDKNPTFVTYYHIDVNESTTDEGYLDIESIIGHRSPTRFVRIKNFPLYGLEAIALNLQDSEQGLDNSYEGEAIIFPNTIKPLPNDIFALRVSSGCFVFRVTEVQTDSIRPDNFYQVRFQFQWIGEEWIKRIEDYQMIRSCTAKLTDIGTDMACIIDDEDSEVIASLNAMMSDMMHAYYALFYNERYNCFICMLSDGRKIFDPLQSVFINAHKLFYRENAYDTLVLNEGFQDRTRKLKYEKSIYKFFERRDLKTLNNFPYTIFPGNIKEDSIFHRWYDRSVFCMDIPNSGNLGLMKTNQILSTESVNVIKLNGPTESKYLTVIQKYILDDDYSIYDIPLTLNDELVQLNGSFEVYLFTPILIYIIKRLISNFMAKTE